MRLIDIWNAIIRNNAGISERQFLSSELDSFMSDPKRRLMMTGRNYYEGKHDIEKKLRTMVGDDNTLISLPYLPNNRICDNKFDDLVDQKVNYLLAKPLEAKCEDERMDEIFTREFNQRITSVARDAYIGGIGYLYPYLQDGELKFKRLKPGNVLPFWRDEEHEVLDAFIYFYDIEVYKAGIKSTQTYVEFYDKEK